MNPDSVILNSANPLLVLAAISLQTIGTMLVRILRRTLLPGLLGCIALTGCSRMPKLPSFKKDKTPAIAPASDPGIAAATRFAVTIIETDVNRQGTIASGTISLDAPLSRATSGTYSLRPSSSNSLLPAGKEIATTLQSNPSGKVQVTHSGTLSIVQFLTKDDTPIFKIMGPPHGNAIKDHWFLNGSDGGIATISPKL